MTVFLGSVKSKTKKMFNAYNIIVGDTIKDPIENKYKKIIEIDNFSDYINVYFKDGSFRRFMKFYGPNSNKIEIKTNKSEKEREDQIKKDRIKNILK
jgi:hypothetical protein